MSFLDLWRERAALYTIHTQLSKEGIWELNDFKLSTLKLAPLNDGILHLCNWELVNHEYQSMGFSRHHLIFIFLNRPIVQAVGENTLRF